MAVLLVAYATRHGSTRGIAERIAQVLQASGHRTDLKPVEEVSGLPGYDGFVIGSAAYAGSWLKSASTFVRRNQGFLAERPLWLFSSGPLGAAAGKESQSVLERYEPKELSQFKAALNPRGTRVFYGALDPSQLSFIESLPRRLPAGRRLMPAGDFRDWPAIEGWAQEIAAALTPASAPVA